MNTISKTLIITSTIMGSMTSASAVNWASGAAGAWSAGVNWGGSVPTSTQLARIGSSGDTGGQVATISSTQAIDRFIIGQNSTFPTNTAEVIINSGSLTTTSGTAHRIGQTSVGIMTVNGGVLDVQNGSITSDAGGVLNINGGDIDFGSSYLFGTGSAGSLNVSGSTADFDIVGAVTAGASSMLDFTFDSAGITPIESMGAFTITSGASLDVDASLFSPGALIIPLATYTGVTGTFAPGTISAPSGYTASLVYGDTSLDLVLTLTETVPEPSRALLLGIGALLLATRRQRASAV